MFYVHCCRELIDTKVTTFEVDISDKDVENDISYFDKEELLHCVSSDCFNVDSDEENTTLEAGQTPFQKIAARMTNLTQDGKVKKQVC
jgi:hypothetical protein